MTPGTQDPVVESGVTTTNVSRADATAGSEGRPVTPITLVLAGHQPLVLNGLCHLFTNEHGFAVLAACGDADSALEALRARSPDVLVLDLEMPASGAFTILRHIRRERLPTQVVMLAGAVDDDQVLDAIRLGARGIVLKEMPPDSLVRCVRTVHAGEPWLERHAVEQTLGRLRRQEVAIRQLARGLTPRETEIARLAIKGVPTKAIAERLAVRHGTVKVHLHNIYDKLQVDGRLGLILFARRHGLV